MAQNPTVTAADLEEYEQTAEKELKKIRAAFRKLATMEHGKVILKHLYDNFVMTACFTKGDPYESALKEGKRLLAIEMIQLATERDQ